MRHWTAFLVLAAFAASCTPKTPAKITAPDVDRILTDGMDTVWLHGTTLRVNSHASAMLHRLAPSENPNNHSPSTLRGDADGNDTVDFWPDGVLIYNRYVVGDSSVVVIEANCDLNCDAIFNSKDFASWVEDIIDNNGGEFGPQTTGMACLPQPAWFFKPKK